MLVFPRPGGTRHRVAVLILGAVACVGACLAFPLASQDAIPPLSVGVRIVDQKYEYVDQKAFLTVLEMQLRFTNKGNHLLILYRRPAVDIGRFALDRESLESGKLVFEDRPYHLYAAEHPIPTLSAKPSRRHFVVLNPGESFDRKVRYGIATGCRDSENVPGSIRRGRFSARFLVDPWPFPKDSAKIMEAQERWSSQGAWITDPILSEPVPILIPNDAGLRQCKPGSK